MSIDDVIAVFEKETFTDIRVMGIGVGEVSPAQFLPHLRKIYFEFEDFFIELTHLTDKLDYPRLKFTLVQTLDFVDLPLYDEDDVTVMSVSVTDLILRESWGYRTDLLTFFYRMEEDLDAGIVDCLAIDITQGTKGFLDNYSTSRYFIHPYTTYGIRVGRPEEQLSWEQDEISQNIRFKKILWKRWG